MTVTSPTRDVSDSSLAIMRRIPFFSGLPEGMLAAIAAKLRREHYVKDDVVVVQGGLGNAMYLIESGQVAVVVQSGSEEQVLSYLGPGTFMGEMALLLGELRSATVRVFIDADLLVFQKSDRDDLLMQYPSIALTFSGELSRRLSFTDHRPLIVKELERAQDFIQLGEDAANRALDQIKRLFVRLPRERAR